MDQTCPHRFLRLPYADLKACATVFLNSARLSESDFPGSSGQHGHLTLSPPCPATPSLPLKSPSESGTNSTLALSRHYTPQAKLHYRRSTCKGPGRPAYCRMEEAVAPIEEAGEPAHALLSQTRILSTNVCAAPEPGCRCGGQFQGHPRMTGVAQTFVGRDQSSWCYGPGPADQQSQSLSPRENSRFQIMECGCWSLTPESVSRMV